MIRIMLIRIVKTSFLVLLCFLYVSCGHKTERVLPILGERDVEYTIIDGAEVADTLYHKVPNFEYLNHVVPQISHQSITIFLSLTLEENNQYKRWRKGHCPDQIILYSL